MPPTRQRWTQDDRAIGIGTFRQVPAFPFHSLVGAVTHLSRPAKPKLSPKLPGFGRAFLCPRHLGALGCRNLPVHAEFVRKSLAGNVIPPNRPGREEAQKKGFPVGRTLPLRGALLSANGEASAQRCRPARQSSHHHAALARFRRRQRVGALDRIKLCEDRPQCADPRRARERVRREHPAQVLGQGGGFGFGEVERQRGRSERSAFLIAPRRDRWWNFRYVKLYASRNLPMDIFGKSIESDSVSTREANVFSRFDRSPHISCALQTGQVAPPFAIHNSDWNMNAASHLRRKSSGRAGATPYSP